MLDRNVQIVYFVQSVLNNLLSRASSGRRSRATVRSDRHGVSLELAVPRKIAMTPIRSRTQLKFIETAGNVCRQLGLPRSLGQIYGLLFFSATALSLDDIVRLLGISKASASTGTRQLAAWGAIRQVWVPGERRDYFEVVPDLAVILRRIYQDFLKPRIAISQKRFDEFTSTIQNDVEDGLMTREESQVCVQRLQALNRLQRKVEAAAPLIERFL